MTTPADAPAQNHLPEAAGPSEHSQWTRVGSTSTLARTGRLHTCINGRYVSVLHIRGQLTCIDSICFHAGGPLALGDIEDVDGKPCLSCPWHNYKIDAFTGEKYFQSVSWSDGKMVPGPWKSNGPRHRIHQVEERPDGLYVCLDVSPDKVASDEYAFKAACGERVIGGPNTASGQSAAAAGADGRRTSSWLSRAAENWQQQPR